MLSKKVSGQARKVRSEVSHNGQAIRKPTARSKSNGQSAKQVAKAKTAQVKRDVCRSIGDALKHWGYFDYTVQNFKSLSREVASVALIVKEETQHTTSMDKQTKLDALMHQFLVAGILLAGLAKCMGPEFVEVWQDCFRCDERAIKDLLKVVSLMA